jgi:hypothetical protein
VRLEELGKLKKLIHLNGSRTRNLPPCSIMPQPLRVPIIYNIPNETLYKENLGEVHNYTFGKSIWFTVEMKAF